MSCAPQSTSHGNGRPKKTSGWTPERAHPLVICGSETSGDVPGFVILDGDERQLAAIVDLGDLDLELLSDG